MDCITVLVHHLFVHPFILYEFLNWNQKGMEKLEIRSAERGICSIATLYSLAAMYKGGIGANRAQLSFTGAKL